MRGEPFVRDPVGQHTEGTPEPTLESIGDPGAPSPGPPIGADHHTITPPSASVLNG